MTDEDKTYLIEILTLGLIMIALILFSMKGI